MKKLLLLLLGMFLLVSCEASSQVILEETENPELYYDSETNYVIVYYGGLPYYKYWYGNQWFYSLVPRTRFPYIRRWTYSYPPVYRRPHTIIPNHRGHIRPNPHRHRPPLSRPDTYRPPMNRPGNGHMNGRPGGGTGHMRRPGGNHGGNMNRGGGSRR